jgi:GDP-4-dehydro-6-deoxy-D-mannose reductase
MGEKVLITGVSGFVGKHLTRELKKLGSQIVGVGHDSQANSEIAGLLERYHSCDLTDKDAVSRLQLDDIDAVVSLAGLARVGDSFADPEKYRRINVEVFSVLAEELLKHGSKVRIIAVSTGAVYDSAQLMPLTEASMLISDGSPYAKSKILMEEAAQKLRLQGLDCVIVRPFNHIGPGQEGGFLLPDLYQKIQEAAKSGGVLKVGNLKTKRDYTDVRDVARAYANLATASHLEHSLYNVCSGRSLEGEEILNLLLKRMNMTGKIKAVQDPSLIRPTDPLDIYGSYERLQKETAWQPQIELDQTTEDFVKAS